MLVCLFSLSWLFVYFRYNDVLVNGLPTWRQPIYYYRKVRKFGFAESAVVLIIIASIIHYAMLWAAYWEKCYEIVSIRNHQQDKSSIGINLKRCTLYLSFDTNLYSLQPGNWAAKLNMQYNTVHELHTNDCDNNDCNHCQNS